MNLKKEESFVDRVYYATVETAKHLTVFAVSVANAYGTDMALGAGRGDPEKFGKYANTSSLGMAVGHGLASATRILEDFLALGGEVVGGTLDATGVWAAVGVPVQTVSTGLAIHGTTVILVSTKNLINTKVYAIQDQANDNTSSSGSSGNSGEGGADATKRLPITSSVKNNNKILKLAEETFEGNNALIKEANSLIAQLAGGNLNPGIGSKSIGNGIYEARGRNGARVYFKNENGGINIVGYSNKSNQQEVINVLIKIYK